LNANTILSLNSTHISYYGRTNSVASQSNVLIGAMDSNRLHLYPNANNVSYNSINTSNIYSGVSINTQGLIVASRNSSSSASSYRNSTLIYNDSTTSTDKPNLNIYIGALNNSGSANYYCNIETSFASIGDGLTSTDVSNLYSLVQAFQTSLSRQV
jgi:hypothetical protein